ncbi:MAG: response regulator transcription factor [Myxococcales bacterium]
MPRSKGDPSKAASALERAHALFEQRAWRDAYQAFVEAEAAVVLGARDLDRMAVSAGLHGNDAGMLSTTERAHQVHLQEGNEPAAARTAFWLGFRLMALGEHGRAQAWFARTKRIAERLEPGCAVAGFLLLPSMLRSFHGGDFETARRLASEALALGERCGEGDLIALARVLLGRTVLRQGEIAAGLELLDEAMLAGTSREISPVVTGLMYCHLLSGCAQVFALDRAREWTAAFEDWCKDQPQLVGFAGACLVHRAELFELGGAWSDAFAEAKRAEERLTSASDPRVSADAIYQQGEIHRLRGELEQAEAAFAQASRQGREPQPGLALLRLMQGRGETALQASRRVLATTSDRLLRARYLPAHVEIALALGQLEDARSASVELTELAGKYDMEALRALDACARGALAIADGQPQAAVEPLRAAMLVWTRIGAPYLVARVQVLLGRACHALGDSDGAALAWSAAHETFQGLGAVFDLAALEGLERTLPSVVRERAGSQGALPRHPESEAAPDGLTPRELQVLRLVAEGKTNRSIARELFLSEKTVDRHVSNIFAKIGVPSRAAATAYAFQRGLM